MAQGFLGLRCAHDPARQCQCLPARAVRDLNCWT
jgi:hypothetical protein